MAIRNLGNTPVLDVEIEIERMVKRAAEAARDADRSLWLAGKIARRIVGKFEVNATRDIAFLAGRSPSTVENWAHAYALYEELIRAGYRREAYFFKKVFTPTHFWTMYDLCSKYKLKPDKVMGYFGILLAHKEQGLPHGASALEREVEADQHRNGNVPSWSTFQKSFYRAIVGALVASDTPAVVRKWLRAAPDCVKELPE